MTPAATFPMQHLCTHVCFMSTWGRLCGAPALLRLADKRVERLIPERSLGNDSGT